MEFLPDRIMQTKITITACMVFQYGNNHAGRRRQVGIPDCAPGIVF